MHCQHSYVIKNSLIICMTLTTSSAGLLVDMPVSECDDKYAESNKLTNRLFVNLRGSWLYDLDTSSWSKTLAT